MGGITAVDNGITITVDATEVDKVNEQIMNRLSAENLEVWLRGPAHDYFKEEIQHGFEGEGSAFSGRWEALRPATVAIREAAGFGGEHPINRRTGEMFSVLTQDADFFATSEGAEMVLPGSAANRGELLKKIQTAQEGSSYNSNPRFGPTNPRPVLDLSDRDAEMLLSSLNNWIATDIAGAFGV